MEIRRAEAADVEAMWRIFSAVVKGGDTYVFAPDTNFEEARAFFMGPGISAFVAVDEGRVMGMYRLVANRRDLGSHVANASYMVDPDCRGKGVGEKLGWHSLERARDLGYLAMQFNFVVSTNERAVKLWQKLGFEIVGALPKAFNHARLGYVDVYVMYRLLN